MENTFKIIWKDNRGKNFEDLVYELLKCMFPHTIFKQTNYVHDGGKDFYSIGNIDEERIWVEAKNYNNHLELSKFSNTFIMADISEINRIIIFSMSEITKGAKINIARYAAYHNKHISVYSGKDIMFLLKKYIDNIKIEHYIENHIKLSEVLKKYNSSEFGISATYEYYRTKQFNLAYRHDKENYIKKNQLINLPLHSLVAQEIHFTNHNFLNEKSIKLDFSKYENSSFEIYFHETKPEYIIVPPASTYILIIFIKVIDIQGKVELPMILFEDADICIETPPCQTECCWLGEIPYMGDGWTKLQNTINLLSKDISKKCIIIEGKSGVGKTRFLQEISGYYFQYGYRIISLDYISITNLSLKSSIQNILSNIYVLDSDDKESSIYVEEFGGLYKDFYDIIYNDSYDCVSNIDKLCTLFIELFKRKKILLLIDNVQDISAETSDFFERLLFNINNQNKVQSHIILCFNKDFISQEKPSNKLLIYIKQLNTSHVVKLTNFSDGDAKIYLRECIDPRNIRPDLNCFFDEIIIQFGTNPFILKQLILYLKQRNIITFFDSMVCVTNFEDMKIVLRELPEGINQILQYRYYYLLRNSEFHDSECLNRIVWSILFLGRLQISLISDIELNSEGIRALIEYGFIEYNEKSEIIFSHQLIEKYFCLFFLNNQYVKNPYLNFIEDEKFLKSLLSVTSRVGKINLCIENMLLEVHLNKINVDNFNLALKKISNISPRAIMIPLIINSISNALNSGIKVDYALEFKAIYAISLACQERFNVYFAAKYTKDLVEYEQLTYREKLSAKHDIITFFKNYVFQLPIEEKYIFLDWLINESNNFGLSNQELLTFKGWIHNRYSKNLCSQHIFDEAKIHAQNALKNALEKNDFGAAAEAEIEYGNVYAYSNAKKTVKHWTNCVNYISKCKNQSVYFKIYKYGYHILSKMLDNDIDSDVISEIKDLLALREQTFLYQKLFIDDIYVDYYIIQYLDKKFTFDEFKEVIPIVIKMKMESYMHTPRFTIIATYKLFTIYRLVCNVEPTDNNIDITTSQIYELIKSGIFSDTKLPYSMMILNEIFEFCCKNEELAKNIYSELSENAQKEFKHMGNIKFKEQFRYAITTLSNKTREVNLLHFNYVF